MAQTETERWFITRGVPHFIVGYSAGEDVLTRAAPFLVLVFLLSSISAIDIDWPAWGIAAAVVAGLGVLLAAWMALNGLRGRRLLERPERIGGVEIAVFLVVPTLLPLLFGGDVAGSAITFVTLLAILAVAYLVTSYGLVPLSAWALRQVLRTVGQTVTLFSRSLPLLLLGFMFLFINAEAWQSAGRLERHLLIGVTVLFALLAAVFLISQIPREMRGLDRFRSWSEVMELAEDAPVDQLTVEPTTQPAPPHLTRREKGNLYLVVLVSQGLRLVLVSSLVGLFFVVLGLLVIRPETISLWTAQTPDVVWEFAIGDTPMAVTAELLQVAVFLAAFAAVYFSVYTTTDRTLRTDFFEDTVAEVRQNLAVRALYRVVGQVAGPM